jgi:uncharacterized protein (DUF1501 family)
MFTMHAMDLELTRDGSVARRSFLRGLSAAAVGAGMLTWADFAQLSAAELKQQGRACILLWMAGGPSQFETFTPKPGHENGGETKAIKTAVEGIEIADNLPEVAKEMKDLCVIRSMTSKEGSHPRATFLLQTGYLPSAGIKYPALGANIAMELRDPACELPGFVRVGRAQGSAAGGFLGVSYDPFVVSRPGSLPDNVTLASSKERYDRRLGLLDQIEGRYEQAGGDHVVAEHKKLYERAAKMITSPRMAAFDLAKEPSKVRDSYGSGQFGAGCLLARRLVEQGVPFVEVVSGGWDTHQDNFTACKRLCGQIDQPFAALLRDLRERGMLEKTLVVWMGEFGRTPRVNPRTGRDHYPRAWNVALAGGGIKGGQVIGKTDAGGSSVTDRPIAIPDLLNTICTALKIDGGKERHTSIGRPVKIVDGGKVIKEALS